MQFVFPSPVTMVKSLSQNQMSKLFFQNITGMVKCRQIVNFEEMDTEWSRGKKLWILSAVKNI